nr:hypothetical protein [Tanacetum cinerariifolium]
MPKNSKVKLKKTRLEDHPRIPSIFNKNKSVTACNDGLNSRTLNANAVCATCGKYLGDSNHFACVTKMLNDVNARTKKPNIIQLILFIVDSRCTKHMMGNLKLLCNFVEKFLGTVCFGNYQFAPILSYGDLVQGNIMNNMVYYVEDLEGNNLITGNHGSNIYTISLQELTSSTPLCLMAKASLTQAWLWHQRLCHLNFDYINLLSKKDIVIGLPKLKYVKDQLCSSYELSKAKGSSFKSTAVPSSKGRLNLFYMDLCGPMRVASINGKKYIMVIVDDYSRYTWTLFLRSKDETPEVLKEFLTMIQRNLQASVITTSVANDTLGLVPQRQKVSDYDNYDPVPQLYNVYSSADVHVPLQQELDLLFGPLYDEFFTAEEEHLQDDEFTITFCTSVYEVDESYSHDIAFSNADHVRCLDTRKITYGGIQFLGDKLVSWMSKKEDCTAMSSAEAETEYQLANMFTKSLPEDRFKYLVRRIGMRCFTLAELEVLANESA